MPIVRHVRGLKAVAALAGLLLVTVPARAAVNLDQHGLTGSWYEPATGGQGIEIEVFADLIAPGTGYLQGSWFTFDHAASGAGDHNRWYTFGGNVGAGSATATLPLYRNSGGNFAALPVTVPEQVGTVTIGFADCANGVLTYDFTDGTHRTGSIPLTRLTPNVTCSPSGSTAPDPEFGYSGNWFDPVTSGQGFVFEVNPVAKVVFFAWYTYSVGGQSQGVAGQRWYTGLASYTPGNLTMPLQLSETTGGRFDVSPPVPQVAQVGTATVSFASCASAHLSYAFTGGSNAAQSGAIELSRVGPVPSGCGAPPGSAAEGAWAGTTSANETVHGVVLEDGTYYFVYSRPGQASDAGVFQGGSSAANGAFASTVGRDYPIANRDETGAGFSAASLDGNYASRSALNVTITEGTSSRTLAAAYDPTYEQPASLAAVAGTYSGISGHTGGRLSATFTLNADGTLTGHSEACSFKGTFAPHKSVNVFDLTVQGVSGGCLFGIGTPISGIILYDAATRQVHALATYDGRADQYYFIGTK